MYHFNLSFSQGKLYKTSSSCSRFTDTNIASPLFAVLRCQTDFRLFELAASLNKHGIRAHQCMHCYLKNRQVYSRFGTSDSTMEGLKSTNKHLRQEQEDREVFKALKAGALNLIMRIDPMLRLQRVCSLAPPKNRKTVLSSGYQTTAEDSPGGYSALSKIIFIPQLYCALFVTKF